MTDPLEEAISEARRRRAAGQADEAVLAYGRAEALAREAHDNERLAHALRHLSDLEREAGEAQAALRRAREAVTLYKNGAGTPLDLANALRLKALALEATGADEEATAIWREAGDLYEQLGVQAGVEEGAARGG